jgi:putative two-component system response regulator
VPAVNPAETLVEMSGHPILCIDDDPDVRAVIGRVLGAGGHDCTLAASVQEARRLLETNEFEVVLCDIGLPGESGLELLAELAHHASAATVMVTGNDNPETADLALELGAYGYVTKPFAPNELLISIASAARRKRLDAARTAQLERAYATIAASETELRRAYAETVARLGRAMEYHDVETGEHVERVAASAHALALGIGLDEDLAERLRLAAPLHDIGKIAISEAILRKPGPLSPSERREMERHAEVGHALLAGSGNELLDLAATIAWTHHERWDGSGYPRRLAGEEIPLSGRVVAIVDVFDALTSDRPYRRAWPEADALAFFEMERGRSFDPELVDALIREKEDGGGTEACEQKQGSAATNGTPIATT